MKKRRKFLIALVVIVLLCQVIPVNRDNPSHKAEFSVSQELQDIFLRSCFDCHSHETTWPWYSRVAPVSWLIAHDVSEGREHLNFSVWSEYPLEKQEKLKGEIWETVSEDEMPPLQYFLAHRDARLSEQDKAHIRRWTETPTRP